MSRNTYIAIIDQDDDGSWTAKWTAVGHGTECYISDAPNPITALKRLATKLRIEDDRRAVINAIDNTDDD